MIEVQATVIGGSVYLAGELVRVEVSFTNTSTKTNETLAWASAQIHCQCIYSEHRIRIPESGVPSDKDMSHFVGDAVTSFVPSRGEKGLTTMATEPAILFCDLTLSPGQTRTFYFCEVIPQGGPPSYRGTAIKYGYKLTIGTQRPHSPTTMLRIPLRVMVLNFKEPTLAMAEEPNPEADVNPFLVSQPNDPGLLLNLDHLMALTSRQHLSSFDITRNKSLVARFSTFKSAYRIGEDVIGMLDFSQATLPCFHVRLQLQAVEKVADEFRASKTSTNEQQQTLSQMSKCCLHCRCLHVNLAIPVSATPSFSTDLIDVSWRLQIEFLTTPPSPSLRSGSALGSDTDAMPASKDKVWKAPDRVPKETFKIFLPLTVMATVPSQANRSLAPPCHLATF